jgi:hypothetical protein
MRPDNFKRLIGRPIHHYRAIFNTVDGILIPILITTGAMTEYEILDKLAKKIFECLIDNYAETISKLKSSKKTFKKNFAEGKQLFDGIHEEFVPYFRICSNLI